MPPKIITCGTQTQKKCGAKPAVKPGVKCGAKCAKHSRSNTELWWIENNINYREYFDLLNCPVPLPCALALRPVPSALCHQPCAIRPVTSAL